MDDVLVIAYNITYNLYDEDDIIPEEASNLISSRLANKAYPWIKAMLYYFTPLYETYDEITNIYAVWYGDGEHTLTVDNIIQALKTQSPDWGGSDTWMEGNIYGLTEAEAKYYDVRPEIVPILQNFGLYTLTESGWTEKSSNKLLLRYVDEINWSTATLSK